tara:strand:+ start:46 stop:600 length:555 start_codon:yes stop_codon:yes gene_type:complete
MNPLYLREGFTHEECDRIVSLESSLEIEHSKMQSHADHTGFRKSQHAWIHVAGNEWIYQKMNDIIMKMNEKFYNFDVDKCEIFQYTIYKETGDHYNWHVDSDQVTDTLLRKISVSVQLSDPSEYEGSDLEIHNTKLYSFPKNKGDVIMFPSWYLHRVTPLISGVRRSLVVWAVGSQKKQEDLFQ